jgi:hypothetical protein
MSNAGKPYVKEERFVKILLIEARRWRSGLPRRVKQPTCRAWKTACDEGFLTPTMVSFRALLPL